METDGQYAIVIECFKYAETVKFVDSNLAFSPYVFYIFLFFIPYEKKVVFQFLYQRFAWNAMIFFCARRIAELQVGGEGK